MFISDGNKTIAQIDDNRHTKTVRYQYDNHLGSASLELDENADIISYEEYHLSVDEAFGEVIPFGTTSYRSGKSEAEVSLKRYKYVGKERDEETGLYYPESLGLYESLYFRGCSKNNENQRFSIFRHYGARYYSSWLARFISVDPLNEKYPELSSYQYASNRPITGIDLDGLEYAIPESQVMADSYGSAFSLDNMMQTKADFKNLLSRFRSTIFDTPYRVEYGVIKKDMGLQWVQDGDNYSLEHLESLTIEPVAIHFNESENEKYLSSDFLFEFLSILSMFPSGKPMGLNAPALAAKIGNTVLME